MAKGKRGFASMDPEKQRAIASKGGKAAHEKGTAHEFTPEKAKLAGRKGGLACGRGRKCKVCGELLKAGQKRVKPENLFSPEGWVHLGCYGQEKQDDE